MKQAKRRYHRQFDWLAQIILPRTPRRKARRRVKAMIVRSMVRAFNDHFARLLGLPPNWREQFEPSATQTSPPLR